MSQGSKTISNGSGSTVRAAINNAIARLATNGKGTGRPSDIAAGEYWIDENTPSSTMWTVFFYDGTDDIVDSYFDTTNNLYLPSAIGAGKATLSSSSTVDLGSTPETSITISGTTTITSFGSSMKAGQMKCVTFSGSLTLTHNGTSLILPGGANIATAAGDTAVVECISSGNYRVHHYTRAATAPLVITPWVAYTPTFTALGTVTNVAFISRRVGDTLEVRGKFTTGTPTAAEARITLGHNGTNNNVTSDATKVPSIQMAGIGAITSSGAFTYYALIESNVGYFTLSAQGATDAALNKANGSAIFGSSVTMSFNAAVPISGW